MGKATRRFFRAFILTIYIINESRYHIENVIKTFADKFTERSFLSGKTQNPPASVTRRKFAMLNAATTLSDLAAVPGNNFEKYQDHRKGQYSIRVNQQYRIFFRWEDGNAYDVRLANEH